MDINEENIFEVNQKFRIIQKKISVNFSYVILKTKKNFLFFLKNLNQNIIHAAALKHVSISEINQDEVINTNIFGTLKYFRYC